MPKQICQSCSMPIKDDKLKGTEADGSYSPKYCHLCYQKGRFTTPDMTVKQMQEIVERVLRSEKHWPSLAARFATKQIPRLERWCKT